MDWFEADEVKALATTSTSPGGRFVDDATERLKRLGAAALTDAELFAVLGVATSEAEVSPLLHHGLVQLVEAPELSFQTAPVLTMRLLGALELARRIPRARLKRPRLFTPHAIATWARTQLTQHRLEEAWVLSLNARNVLLRYDRAGLGGVDHCIIDAREALAPAVACRASGIVLLHTHPAGDPEPSANDVALTRRLKTAAAALNIALLDHLVLTELGAVSMLERGLLDGGRASPLLRKPMLSDEDD